MGGGGAMRAAAKVGIGAVNCGFRGTISEHPVTSAARKASRHVSANASCSSNDDIRANVHVASSECKPAWPGLDDWEFAGGEQEEHVPVRLVFGGAPSFREAKEATFELKEALEKAYLSSDASTGFGDFDKVGHVYGYSDVSDTKACLTSERILAPAPSHHAIQAFRFLSENTTAQNVVASIASDPNVWNAVLQNPDLQEFLESQKSNATGSVTDDLFYQPSPKGSDGYSENGESNPGGLASILDNIKDSIKVAVVDIWSSLSDFFQNLFMGPSVVDPNADGSARIGFTDKALGMSFVGLAAMAMVVVVLKRN